MNIDYSLQILFIKGVFLKDCIPIDDIFERQIIERLNYENPVDIYIQLPKIFNNISSWIPKTNIKCWYCDLNFENSPVFLPTIIEPSTVDSNIFNVGTLGCFCSFCCAGKYNNVYNTKTCENIKMKEKLLYIYKQFYGVSTKEILISPCKYEMIQYGGVIDPMTYRNKIHQLEKKMLELKSIVN